MFSFRDSAPLWIKNIVWNLKHSHETARAPKEFVRMLASHLTNESRLLDLGCGGGNLLIALREAGWQGDYTGADISSHSIATARRLNDPRARWVVSPIEGWKETGLFDAICFVETIYYVPLAQLDSVLARAHEHLRPNGHVFVRICNRARHEDYVKHIQERWPQILLTAI